MIEGLRRIVLGEHTSLVDGVGKHVVTDLLGGGSPLRGQRVLAAAVSDPRAGVGGHPAGDLGEGEVLRTGADLPYALVGLTPMLERTLHLGLHNPPQTILDAAVARAYWQCRI